MATGVAGSSFTSELNRLANSGTYPVLTSYLAATGAANDYANTTDKALIASLITSRLLAVSVMNLLALLTFHL